MRALGLVLVWMAGLTVGLDEAVIDERLAEEQEDERRLTTPDVPSPSPVYVTEAPI